MKRLLIVTIVTLFSWVSASAGPDRVFERTYVSTDRDTYVAGERIWCSAFCFDAGTGRPSEFSRVAYLQLVSSNGFLAGSKIDLESGRGAGYIDIPLGTATGNYKLVAFTAVNKNEQGFDFLSDAKVLSIFNTLSTDRVPGAVEVVSDDPSMELPASSSGGLSVSARAEGGKLLLDVQNRSGKAVSFSASVWHDDGLRQIDGTSLASFKANAHAPGPYVQNVLPEFDGEIIYADVTGPDREKVLGEPDRVSGYISTIGSPNDVYIGALDGSGRMIFRTDNIYGNKDLVCEINSSEGTVDAHLDIRSPFLNLKPADIPALKIFKGMEERLVARTASLKATRSFVTDSLDEFLPRRENLLLTKKDALVYNSADYTRFNTVAEVLTEYVKEVRWRGSGENTRVEVLVKDITNLSQPSWKQSLVMLDGIPIFRHDRMLAFDAMLVDAIQVWQNSYMFGGKTYDGAVNFITKVSDISYMDFGTNVRIVDFSGVAYPLAYTGIRTEEGGSDLRQTVLWQPLMEAGAGKTVNVSCELPDYHGKFRATVEGTDEEGNVSVSEVIFEL